MTFTALCSDENLSWCISAGVNARMSHPIKLIKRCEQYKGHTFCVAPKVSLLHSRLHSILFSLYQRTIEAAKSELRETLDRSAN